MEKKLVKVTDDCNKSQRTKPDPSTDAVLQEQSLVKLAYMISYGAKMRSPAYTLHSDFIKKALECRRPMSQTSMARGTLQIQFPIRQVTPMFRKAKLHPLRCRAQPDVGTKMVETFQQTNQTGAYVRTVVQVQVTGNLVVARQVVAMLSNQKVFPLKYTILANIREEVGDNNCEINQKERSKVKDPMRPTKDTTSVSNEPRRKMTWTQLTVPTSPAVALKNFQDELTNWEQKEIQKFLKIWYLDLGVEKMKGFHEMLENSEDPSYDDAKSIYTLVTRNHIACRYEILLKLGQGFFCLVLKCWDHKTKELVTLTIIHNMKSNVVMEERLVQVTDDCNKSQRTKSAPDTDAVLQEQSLVKLAYMISYGAKMRSPAYTLHSDFIKKALECRHPMSQTSMARGTLQIQFPIRQVTPMFRKAKLHPLRCRAQPDVGTKMVETFQQTNQTGADVRTVVQLQVTDKQVLARQVVAMLCNPKFLPLKYTILANIRKEVGDNKCQINQKERSKVKYPMRPTKDTKSVSNKPRRKMTWAQLTVPISPAVALKYFRGELTNWEQKEILEFPKIWYLGLGVEKVKGFQEMQENSEDLGYDDAKGVYIPVACDHIAYRYEILERLGQGSFGLVLKCWDHKTKEMVALKIIHNTKSANCMAIRELDILQVVRKEDEDNRYNVIHMKEYMTFRKHLCITFELQGITLYRLIRDNDFQGLSWSQTLRYAVELVTCLQMLHSHKIVHCDLKPENILLSEQTYGKIKVADFGCSFFEHQKRYTYVQTRFYRAPEVILGLPFGIAVDMWSLGCILAELHNGIPLFAGANELDQLACIMEVMAMPPKNFIRRAPRRKVFFDSNGQLKTGTRRQCTSTDLVKVLRKADTLFVDFIRRCLVWDPAQRMTADEATSHQWLQKLVKME